MGDPANNSDGNKQPMPNINDLQELFVRICEYYHRFQQLSDEELVRIETGRVTGYGAAVTEMDDLSGLQLTNFDGYIIRLNPDMKDSPLQLLYCSIANTLYVLQHYTDRQLILLVPISMLITVGLRSNDHSPEFKEYLRRVLDGCDLILTQIRALHRNNLESTAENAPHQ